MSDMIGGTGSIPEKEMDPSDSTGPIDSGEAKMTAAGAAIKAVKNGDKSAFADAMDAFCEAWMTDYNKKD